MSTRIFIAPTTEAVISDEFTATVNNCIGLTASGLTGTEAIKIRVSTPASSDSNDPWLDVDTMTVAKPAKSIYLDTNTWRLEKPVTASPVGVSLAEDEFTGS